MPRFRLPSPPSSPESFDRVLAAGAVERAGGSRGGALPVLVSRALYRTRAFDLQALKSSERTQALQLQVAAWAPFEVSAYRVGLRGSRALAFAWDQLRLGEALDLAGCSPDRPVSPEGLHRPALALGLRIHRCLEGFEAQVWRDGWPIESQWWPAWPEAAAWQAFLRSSRWEDTFQGAEDPTDAATPWLAQPWLPCVPLERLGRETAGWERLVALGTGCALAAFAGLQWHDWQQAQLALTQARAERAELEERARPQQQAREAAWAAADRANRLATATLGTAPLEVMEQLSSALPGQGTVLQELLLEGRRLRVTLTLAGDLPRSAVVQQLQAAGYFSQVNEVREGVAPGSVVFEMMVNPVLSRSGPAAEQRRAP